MRSTPCSTGCWPEPAPIADDTAAPDRTGARGGATDGPEDAIQSALADLWQETALPMSRHWRDRFRRHLHDQRIGCLREHHLRRTGAVPTVEEYPLLRRRSSGMWLYDLPEAILRIELPPAFAATALWQELTCHIGDAANWCNDLLSWPKETSDRLTVNALLVARHRLGLTDAAAAHLVTTRIADRLDRAAALGRRAPDTAERLGLSPAAVRDVSRVACATLNFPAAYLAWALHSARYPQHTEPAEPADRPPRLHGPGGPSVPDSGSPGRPAGRIGDFSGPGHAVAEADDP